MGAVLLTAWRVVISSIRRFVGIRARDDRLGAGVGNGLDRGAGGVRSPELVCGTREIGSRWVVVALLHRCLRVI